MGRKKKKDTENLPAAQDQLLASDIVKSVCAEKNGSRPVEFILYVLSGKSIADAAKEAGYALNHGYRLMKKYRTDAKFRDAVTKVADFFPDWYISTTKLKVPRLATLDNKILDKFDTDIELAIKHPQALKQIKQTAGVLPSDEQPKGDYVVNIEKMQTFIQRVLKPSGEVIDIPRIADQGHGEGE